MIRASHWVAPAVLVLGGCGGGDDGHPDDQHATCSFEYNSAWQGSGLVLVHDDLRDCPTSSPYGTTVSTGGTIYQENVYYPDHPDHRADRVELTIWDDINNPESLIKEMTQFFAYGTSRTSPNPPFEWQATPSVSYQVRDNPDYGLFKVHFARIFPTPITPAEALMTITYYGTQM